MEIPLDPFGQIVLEHNHFRVIVRRANTPSSLKRSNKWHCPTCVVFGLTTSDGTERCSVKLHHRVAVVRQSFDDMYGKGLAVCVLIVKSFGHCLGEMSLLKMNQRKGTSVGDYAQACVIASRYPFR